MVNELIANIDRIHTTELGAVRIKKNLSLNTEDAVEWCKAKILSDDAAIERQGKNWYIAADGVVITVNAYSYTIITAHKARNELRNSGGFGEESAMLVSKIKEKDLTVEVIDKLLFQGIEDTGEDADCIIVLGSAKAARYRVPAAVNAYSAGRARKMILCGGAMLDFPSGRCSEAEYMYRAVLEFGVDKENVIREGSSQNTVENILFAMIELQRAFGLNNVRKVLLVTAAYHMRRSLAIARYLLPEHIAVIPCPANDTNTRRDNWMNTPVGIKRAKGEAVNLINCAVNGTIRDFEI